MAKPRFSGWRVVGASLLAMSAGNAPLGLASLGLFMLPLEEEFGWNRAQVSWCSTLLIGSMVICIVLAGRLVDRLGTRTILLPSILLTGLTLAMIPTFVQELWHLWALFLLLGVVGTGTNVVTYMPTLSAWFFRHRGLAIGLAVSGIGLGYTYVPLLAQTVIDAYGWRAAYYSLGAIAVFVALPIAYFGIVQKPADLGQQPDGISGPPPASTRTDVGFTTRDALRMREFWMMLAIFLMLAFATYGVFVHLVPMLIDRGMSRQSAAGVAAFTGGSVLIGRVLVGFLVDRFFAPRVAMLVFIVSALGMLMLLLGVQGSAAYLAAVMIGLAIGAESDLLAYLASRYFGLRSLGSIFGLQSSAYMCGSAFGPIAFGLIFESTGAYSIMLIACIVVVAVSVVLTALLPAFPRWESTASEDAAAAPAQAPATGGTAPA